MSPSSDQSLTAVALEDLDGMPDPTGAAVGEVLTVTSLAPFAAAWQAAAGAFVPLAGGTMTGALENVQDPATDVAFQAQVTGDTDWRLQVTVGGVIAFGSGNAAPDAFISRDIGGRIRIQSLLNVDSGINTAGAVVMTGTAGIAMQFGNNIGNTAMRLGLAADAFNRFELYRGGLMSFSDGTTDPSSTMRFGYLNQDTLAMLDPPGANPPGKIHHNYTIRTLTTGGSTVLGAFEEQIFVDSVTAGATNPRLPAPVEGRTVVIKDVGFNASVDIITIDAVGGEDIDGSGSYVISTDGESVTLRADGVDWWIVSRYTP